LFIVSFSVVQGAIYVLLERVTSDKINDQGGVLVFDVFYVLSLAMFAMAYLWHNHKKRTVNPLTIGLVVSLVFSLALFIFQKMTNGEVVYVDSPSKLPPLNNIAEIREPIAECNMLVPQEFLGNVITLCVEKRGVQTNMVYHGNQIALTYEIPMGEVVLDFFDRLKSTSRGYASLDYGFKRFQAADMVRVDIMINGDRVDALALIVHKDNAPYRGRELVEKMRELIPRQQFDIAIQAAIGNHIIARSTVKQLRKNVLAKCYGGDVSRKKKLLQKQKEGKKRMKSLGNVEVPQEAFLAILHVGKDK